MKQKSADAKNENVKLEGVALDLLHDIFHNTRFGGYINIDDIETMTGLRGSVVRVHVECLKNMGLVFERENGLFISEKGKDFAEITWA